MTFFFVERCWTLSFEFVGVRSEFVRGSSEIIDLHFFQWNQCFKTIIKEIQGLTTIFEFFLVIALISKKSQKFWGLNNIFKFSLVTSIIKKKNMENSRIERYFQVFTGDFNDFQQNHGKFKDWTVFSSVHWWLYWFHKKYSQFKDFKRIFKFSLVTSKDWRVFSSVRWWL